jgi:hypothetical protein
MPEPLSHLIAYPSPIINGPLSSHRLGHHSTLHIASSSSAPTAGSSTPVDFVPPQRCCAYDGVPRASPVCLRPPYCHCWGSSGFPRSRLLRFASRATLLPSPRSLRPRLPENGSATVPWPPCTVPIHCPHALPPTRLPSSPASLPDWAADVAQAWRLSQAAVAGAVPRHLPWRLSHATPAGCGSGCRGACCVAAVADPMVRQPPAVAGAAAWRLPQSLLFSRMTE